jgi:hypothetical protein
MSKQRIIYYYQTFCGLGKIFDLPRNPVTDIHLGAIHFGYDKNNEVYIHLNNHSPWNPRFDRVWKDMNEANKIGIDVSLMIGGAGGGFKTLFESYDESYQLLYTLLASEKCITGVNLDVEEEVDFEDLVWLVNDLRYDFPYLTISFAPVAGSLQSDTPGLGGFSYRDVEDKINPSYYNTQFYNSFSLTDYSMCVNNGYPPEKIVMGMLAEPSQLKDALRVLQSVNHKYPNMGGSYVWEYYDSYEPPKWALEVEKVLEGKDYYLLL